MSIVISTADNANLQSYDGLVASIQSRMDRTDIASDIPDFIYLAEREMERLLVAPYRETTDTLTIDAATVSLPTDFKSLRSLTLNTEPKRNLSQVTPSVLTSNWTDGTAGIPAAFAIVGLNLMFAPIPDDTYTATIIYLQALASLNSSNQTNWILDRSADAYFYGALMQGFAHVADDQRALAYRTMFLTAIEQINKDGLRHRYSSSPIRLRNPSGV